MSAPADAELAGRLRAAVAAVLRVDSDGLDPESSLRDLGVNSMRAMRVAAQLESWLGAEVRPWLLLEHDRLGDVVAALARELAGTTPDGSAEDEPAADRPDGGAADSGRALSHAEQMQWYLGWSQPDSTSYVFAGAVRLRGELSVDALRAALRAVVSRHQPLRTSYRIGADGEPRAFAGAAWDFDLPVEDLRATPDATLEAALRRSATPRST